jgi:DNA-binding GntR family transcriptional regulator
LDVFEVPLDRRSPVPLYFQLSQGLRLAIEDGRIAPGTRIDTEIALAEQLGVSRPTVRSAIKELVDSGLVIKRRGLGTIVAPVRVKRPVALTSLYDDLSQAGQRPTTEVLDFAEEKSDPDVAEALGLDPRGLVIRFDRLRRAKGEPIALMRNYVPPGLVPLTAERLERTGLYRLFASHGIRLQMAHQHIGARLASASEARLLDVPARSPLLTMRRTTVDERGRAVEFATHCYPAERYSFEMSLVTR